MSPPAALSATEVKVQRGPFALGPVSFSLAQHEALVVFGPSLAGKSTLLKALAGLLPSDGQIAVEGHALWRDGHVATEAQHRLGVVFQSDALFDSMTSSANVALPLLRRGATKADAEARAQFCLEEVGLGSAGHKLPEQLSGGMRKRVALARALAPRCPVLLIDDPLAGLDPATTLRIVDLLAEARDRKHALVIATADPTPLWSLATSALALEEGGRAVAIGAPPSVQREAHHLLAAS